MKISYNWLKEYIDIDIDPIKLEKILTSIGLEVEGIETFQSIKGGLEGLVIGKVLSCEKHPDADKLSITSVDIGNNTILPIVCGAPNVAKDQMVVVATVGTTLYSNDEAFVIKKSKIRGQVSEGMICADDEIGLGTSHDGIRVLPDNVTIGTLAKDYFKVENDIVFEIGLTPNRIDAASHFGVARDIAAFLKNNGEEPKLRMPSVDAFKVDNHSKPIEIIVDHQEACPRYMGLSISNVEVKESPDWLKNRLKAIGQKPINNVVDITNYVLHETGHPLHAFDADKISGQKVIVKTLPDKSKFTSLDEVERELNENDLMICNTDEGMCIAGVFGGIGSGVKNSTKNIFLESAFFNPVFVRKTAKRHLLNTDASFRFERGADINITPYALKRTALLIKEIAGGEISSEISDVYPQKIEQTKVELSFNNVDRLIGEHIERNQISSILQSLDIAILEKTENGLLLEIPSYRVDVTREADVIEELLRIYGYNTVKISDKVYSTLSYSKKPEKEKLIGHISNLLADNGFNEIMNNSLSKTEYYEGLNEFPDEQLVRILNPLSRDLSIMRQTLLFGGLESIGHNVKRQNSRIKFFEFGKTYHLNKKVVENPVKNYSEKEVFALFLYGENTEENWISEKKENGFFQIKSYVERILNRIGIKLSELKTNSISDELLAEGLELVYQNRVLGKYGIVQSSISSKFDLKRPVFYAELHWEKLYDSIKNNKISFESLSKYPEVRRDLALLIDKNTKYSQIEELALKTEKKLLKRINLFDVYEGNNLPEGKKSYAIAFYLQDKEKTLTDKQIDKVMKRFIYVFETELNAQLR